MSAQEQSRTLEATTISDFISLNAGYGEPWPAFDATLVPFPAENRYFGACVARARLINIRMIK
jgi:hypothetical protein